MSKVCSTRCGPRHRECQRGRRQGGAHGAEDAHRNLLRNSRLTITSARRAVTVDMVRDDLHEVAHPLERHGARNGTDSSPRSRPARCCTARSDRPCWRAPSPRRGRGSPVTRRRYIRRPGLPPARRARATGAGAMARRATRCGRAAAGRRGAGAAARARRARPADRRDSSPATRSRTGSTKRSRVPSTPSSSVRGPRSVIATGVFGASTTVRSAGAGRANSGAYHDERRQQRARETLVRVAQTRSREPAAQPAVSADCARGAAGAVGRPPGAAAPGAVPRRAAHSSSNRCSVVRSVAPSTSRVDAALARERDGAVFLGDDEHHGVGLLGEADRGAVPRAERLRHIGVGGERQEAAGRGDASVLDDERSVVDRASRAGRSLVTSSRDTRASSRVPTVDVLVQARPRSAARSAPRPAAAARCGTARTISSTAWFCAVRSRGENSGPVPTWVSMRRMSFWNTITNEHDRPAEHVVQEHGCTV